MSVYSYCNCAMCTVFQVMELLSNREPQAVYHANGLTCAINFVRLHSLRVHRDAVQSALNLIGRICARVEIPANALAGHVEKLTALLSHAMPFVSDGALRCYQNLIDRHLRRGSCGESLANPATVDLFSARLRSLVGHLETASFADRLAISSSIPLQAAGGAGGASAGLLRSSAIPRRDRTVSALLLPTLTDPGRSSASVTAIVASASTTSAATQSSASAAAPITGSLESKVTAILNVLHSLSTGSPSVSERLLGCDSMLDVFVVALFAKDEACVALLTVPSLSALTHLNLNTEELTHLDIDSLRYNVLLYVYD